MCNNYMNEEVFPQFFVQMLISSSKYRNFMADFQRITHNCSLNTIYPQWKLKILNSNKKWTIPNF